MSAPTQAQVPHDHAGHQDSGGDMFSPRDASATAWLFDSTPMYGILYSGDDQAGPWQVMGHGNVFVQFLNESGERGSRQLGSINWFMGMARRELAGGRFGLR